MTRLRPIPCHEWMFRSLAVELPHDATPLTGVSEFGDLAKCFHVQNGDISLVEQNKFFTHPCLQVTVDILTSESGDFSQISLRETVSDVYPTRFQLLTPLLGQA